MSRHKCTKELYKAFLQASSVRYSGLALSEVSPSELSHDGIIEGIRSLHARSFTNQQTEAKIMANILNKMTHLGMPNSEKVILDK